MSDDHYAAAREIANTIVMHTEFERVLNAADDHIEMAGKAGDPISLLVTAAPGMGKTAVLNLIANRVRQRFASLSNDDPLVSLAFGPMVDPHRLAGEFLEALGFASTPARTNLVTITRMINMALERMKPHVGLIDEAQHVCEGCREITAQAVTDWLKLLMDRHRLVFVLAGTHTLQRLREINPQFASRAPTDLAINTFTYGPTWHQLLDGLRANVRAVDMAILTDRRVARPVFEGACGNLRRLKKWLEFASYFTLSQQRTEVSRDDLQRGFDHAFGTNSNLANPFKGNA